MSFKKLIGLGCMALLLNACGSSAQKVDQTSAKTDLPNILILHVDDLGYHDLSINGSKIYETPYIDQLARESVRFTNAYANYPRCVPSRYAMMMGGYPIQDGEVPDDGFKIENISKDKNHVIALKDAGYDTAYFGKWHLGDDPKEIGFDKSVAAGKAGSPISFIYPFNEQKWGNGKSIKAPIEGLDASTSAQLSDQLKPGDYLTDVLTDRLLDHIENRPSDKPFMTQFSFYAVHQPLEAKQPDIDRNKKQIDAFDYGDQPEYIKEGTGRTKMRQDHPKYAAMVEILDQNVGRIIAKLKEEGLYENTIIIFSSDHGGLSNDGTNQRDLATSNYPLRAGKGWLYEGGIKVPLFVKFGDRFASRDENSLVALMDIYPTLVDMTSQQDLNTDGQSIASLLSENESWNDRTIFWHSEKARPRNTGDTKSSAIRQGDYKLIHWYKEPRVELYNITLDPAESNDLSGQKPELTAQLLAELNNWKYSFQK